MAKRKKRGNVSLRLEEKDGRMLACVIYRGPHGRRFLARPTDVGPVGDVNRDSVESVAIAGLAKTRLPARTSK